MQFEALVVIGPSGVITLKEGGLGRLIWESNVFRSAAIDGEPPD